MEALIRWQNPDLGLVSPEKFIPLAKETGLILPIGEWVLRTACAQNKTWQKAGLPPKQVAVNLSSHQFKQEKFTETIRRVLNDTGLDPRYLTLEITESILMQDTQANIASLQALKGMGLEISIDDFGTGYSSLGYLKRFPVDTLKIDRSFIKDILTDPDNRAITKAIIVMAHTLKLRVIAEGVETEPQQAMLREQGCDEAQGYLFSRPLPAKSFEEFLRGRNLSE